MFSVRIRPLIDILVVGILSLTILVLLLHFKSVRLGIVAFFLVILGAVTGKFVNEFGLKTTIKIGIEMQFYGGMMVAYLSTPWVGSLVILLSFYLMNRVYPVKDALLRRKPLKGWVFVEGIKDLLHYFFLEPNMWAYIVLLFVQAKLAPFLAIPLLWIVISLIGSTVDSLLNLHFPIDRPDDIGRAPIRRFFFYLVLFYTLSPAMLAFVQGT